MKEKEMSFEEALNRLNEISELMENPEITLKNAVELYEEADKLVDICGQKIKDAKIVLEKIEE